MFKRNSGAQGGREARVTTRETVIEEVIAESFPKFQKDVKPCIQSIPQGPNKINTINSDLDTVLQKIKGKDKGQKSTE